jgi:hypothetical protein
MTRFALEACSTNALTFGNRENAPFLEQLAVMFVNFVVHNPSCQMAHLVRESIADPF